MEENLNKETIRQFVPGMTKETAGSYSPLVLAFTGDAAYELAVRTMLVCRGNARPAALNARKARLVKASAQSSVMEVIEGLLTEEEEAVYRRGRNAKSYTMAKNATVGDYRRATGFEALIGYLYLCGRMERMFFLIEEGLKGIGEGEK